MIKANFIREQQIKELPDMYFLMRWFEKEGWDISGIIRLTRDDVMKLISDCNWCIARPKFAKRKLPVEKWERYNEAYFEKVTILRNFLEKEFLPEFGVEDNLAVTFENR